MNEQFYLYLMNTLNDNYNLDNKITMILEEIKLQYVHTSVCK